MQIVKTHKILLIIFFLLSLLITFRGNTRDTYNYKYVYEHLPYLNLNSISDFYARSGMEIGYGYLGYLSSFIVDDFRFLFFLISFTILFCLYKISDGLKIKASVFLIVYITNYYFFMQQFMQIRQGFSSAVVFLGAYLLFKRKYFLSLVLFLIGLCFHQSALAFLVFILGYIIFRKIIESHKNNFLLYILIMFLVIVICKSILMIIPNYFVRIASYSDSEYSQVLSPFRLTSLRFYFLFIFYSWFFYIYFKYEEYKKYTYEVNSFLIFLLVTYAVGLGVRIGFNDFAILSTRLSEFFLYSEIFLLSFIFSRRIHDIKFLILFILYLFFQVLIMINQFDYVFVDYFKEIH